jgi:predicted  nucleic acid-binding Zn-ribbon protein
MASNSDIINYSGCSFNDLVDMLMSAQAAEEQASEELDSVRGQLEALKDEVSEWESTCGDLQQQLSDALNG